MIRQPPRVTRTDIPVPYTTRFRSGAPGIASWSTSCRITTGSRFGLIESRSPGSSMVKNDRAPSRLSIGANAVASDNYDVLGPLYSEIGGELAKIVGGDPDGVHLYAEAGQGRVAPSVFPAEAAVVRSFDDRLHLSNLTHE